MEQDIISTCKCDLNGREVNVQLYKDFIRWDICDTSKESGEIDPTCVHEGVLLEYVIAVEKTTTSNIGNHAEGLRHKLILNYAERGNDPHPYHLQHSLKVFTSASEGQINQLYTYLNQYLIKDENRPHNLLVLINPKGGQCLGEEKYKTLVEPIFNMAHISTDVRVLEYGGHAGEILQSYDLSSIDGLVTVSGDGTFFEIVNALQKRAMLEANLDENDPECLVPPSNLRLGAIGAGTGNGVAVISTGVLNTDNGVTSNAIYISLGVSSLSMDTNHIFCNKKLVCRQLLMSGYGFYGDVFYDSEQARWAGTKRYIYAVLKNFIRHRTHETEISYLPHDSPEGGDWVTIQGRYKGILQFNFIFNPGNGREEFESSLQNGFMYIYCLKECSRWQHLLRWKRWIDSIRFKQGYTLHEPYEDLYVAKAFRIKAIGPDASLPINSRASFDGEFHQLEKSDFEVRVQRRSVKLFGVLHKDPPKDGTPV